MYNLLLFCHVNSPSHRKCQPEENYYEEQKCRSFPRWGGGTDETTVYDLRRSGFIIRFGIRTRRLRVSFGRSRWGGQAFVCCRHFDDSVRIFGVLNRDGRGQGQDASRRQLWTSGRGGWGRERSFAYPTSWKTPPQDQATPSGTSQHRCVYSCAYPRCLSTTFP